MTKPFERSFLKWAGNKYSVLHHIIPNFLHKNRLIEPFAGSAVVSLNSNLKNYILAETNQDLINVYRFLKQYKNKFIDDCSKYFIPENNSQTRYYELRNLFNMTVDPYERALLFIYLNRHSYNGLCRYNSRLIFNAPFGKYKQPKLPEAQMRYFITKAHNMEFNNADFRSTLQIAKPGDVVYCDPPYTPLSKTASFTQYNGNKFSNADHIELTKLAENLSENGVTVIISNHDLEYTRNLYINASIKSFEVNRHINCDSANRNKVRELLAIYRGG